MSRTPNKTALLEAPAAEVKPPSLKALDATPKKPLELSNPLAARILADPEVAVLLKPFMRKPTTVKAAAEAFRLPLQTMHYRVLQMLQAGLLEVVGVEPRQGRPIKHYRATATAFQIPLDLVPSGLLENLTQHVSWKAQLERGLQQALNSVQIPIGTQLMVYLNSDGLLIWSDGLIHNKEQPDFLAPEYPAVLNHWTGGLRLDQADAKALQRELWELYQRYAHRGGAEKYVLHLGLAPTPDP